MSYCKAKSVSNVLVSPLNCSSLSRKVLLPDIQLGKKTEKKITTENSLANSVDSNSNSKLNFTQ